MIKQIDKKIGFKNIFGTMHISAKWNLDYTINIIVKWM